MTTSTKAKPNQSEQGHCYLCDQNLNDLQELPQHLNKCMQAWAHHTPQTVHQALSVYAHVKVTTSDNHWMHVAIHHETTFQQVDHFISQTCLESCKHPSMFQFGGLNLPNYPEHDNPTTYVLNDIDTRGLVEIQDTYLHTMLPGMTVTHRHDMADSTETQLTTITLYPLPDTRPIIVIARNNPDPCNPSKTPHQHPNTLVELQTAPTIRRLTT